MALPFNWKTTSDDEVGKKKLLPFNWKEPLEEKTGRKRKILPLTEETIKPLSTVEVAEMIGYPVLRAAPPEKEKKDTWLKRVARFILPRSLEIKLGITEPTEWELMMQHEDDRLNYLRRQHFKELYRKEIIKNPKVPKEYKEPTTFIGQFLEGIKEGYISMKSSFGYFVESLGRQIGSPKLLQWGANLGDKATIELIKKPELLEPEDLKPFFKGGWVDRRWWGRRIGQTLPTIGTMLGLATFGGFTGGIPGALTGGFVSAAALEKGAAYKRYINEGVPPDKADIYSNVYGTIAGLIENAFGISPAKIGTQIAIRGIERVVYNSYKQFLLREVPKIGFKTLKQAIAEGGEEVAQSIAENLVLKFYKKETPVFSKGLAEEFAGGFAAAIPFGAINIRIPEIKKITPKEVKAIEQTIKEADEVLKREIKKKPTEIKIEGIPEDLKRDLNKALERAKRLNYSFDEFRSFVRGGATQGKEYLVGLRKYGLSPYSERISKLGVNPEREVIVYRGIDFLTEKPVKKIRDGDFVTTDYEHALEFAGMESKWVVKKKVKAKDLIVKDKRDFNPKEPFYKYDEFIYSHHRNPLIRLTDEQLKYFYNQAVKGVKEAKLPKFPENKYKLELLEEIRKLEELPKIDPEAFEFTPKTVSYNNPYTRVMTKVWNRILKIWDSKAPRVVKEAQTQEIARLLRERQRVYDGLVKKYYEEIIRPLTKLTTAEKQKIGNMIFKRIDVPEEYKSVIKDIDVKIGQLGEAIVNLDKEMIKKGLLPKEMTLLTEETWLSHLGEYARTLYVRVDPKTGKPVIVPRSVLTKEGVIDRSAFKRKLTDEEWGANALQFEGKTLDEIKQYTIEELRAIGQEAKEKYGWVFQADYILARTFKDLSKAYATRLFQKAIVENPRLFTKDVKLAEELGFVSVRNILPKGVEKDVRLGPLNYGYIHPGLQEELRTFVLESGRDTVMSIFQEPLSWWKAFKVAGNPPTIIRNWLSGMFFQTDMAGYPVWTPKNSARYIKAVKSYLTKDKVYKKFRDNGLYGTDYFTVEIETDELARIITKAEKSNNPLRAYSEGLLSKLGTKLKDAKQVFSYYGHIDHIQRTYLALCTVEDGASIPQAVHFANKWELDYRFVPQIIEKLRTGIGGWLYPFLSFYTLIAPRIAEVLITRPWVLLKYPIIIGVFNAIAVAMLGADEDEIENAKPEWLKDRDYVLILPFRDNQGNFVFMDLDYTLPFGGPESLFMDWTQVTNMAKFPGLMNIMINIFNNYDTYTQRKIYNETDLPEEKRKKIAEYVARSLGPGAVPHALNIYRAATGEIIGFPMRRERDLAQSIARTLGVSVYSGGFNEAFWKIRNLQQEIKDIQWAMVLLMQNPNIPPEKKKEKVIEFQDEIRRRTEKIQEIAKAMPSTAPIKEKGKKLLPIK